MMEKKIHRKIWEAVHGPIPKDINGRTYEIHHINGDHQDNRLENLSCVTIEEHLAIHLAQGDWGAVAAITKRLKISPEVQRELNSLAGKDAVKRKLGWHAQTVEEHRAVASMGGKAVAGMLWYNDGKKQTKFKADPGLPWKRGRLPSNYGMKKGTVLGQFWNDGKRNQRSVECPGAGWVLGKLLTPEQRQKRSEVAKSVCKKRWHHEDL